MILSGLTTSRDSLYATIDITDGIASKHTEGERIVLQQLSDLICLIL